MGAAWPVFEVRYLGKGGAGNNIILPFPIYYWGRDVAQKGRISLYGNEKALQMKQNTHSCQTVTALQLFLVLFVLYLYN